MNSAHPGADPHTPTVNLPMDDLDVGLGATDAAPISSQDYPPDPIAPASRTRKRSKTAPVPADAKQISDMLVLVFDGIARASLGMDASLTTLEHEYIDPSLERLIDRHLPEKLTGRAASYADILLLGFGLSLWGIRIYQLRPAQKRVLESIRERFEQAGTVTQNGFDGPPSSPEAAAWRAQQMPPTPPTGEVRTDTVPPLWDDTVSMQE